MLLIHDAGAADSCLQMQASMQTGMTLMLLTGWFLHGQCRFKQGKCPK